MTKALYGSDYRGFQTTTRGGNKCQRWDKQYPQKHTRTPQIYPINGLNSNYCRNPDSSDTIWCYTQNRNKRWEYCNPIPAMKMPKGSGYNRIKLPDNPYICDETLRGKLDSGYRGCQTKTRSGRRCQAWAAQYPHKHTRGGNWFYGTDGTHSKCRNPDGEKTIWCYTTDPASRWEYCDPLPQSYGGIIGVVVILCGLCCCCGYMWKQIWSKDTKVEDETHVDQNKTVEVAEEATEMKNENQSYPAVSAPGP